jgi:hypothetical protein
MHVPAVRACAVVTALLLCGHAAIQATTYLTVTFSELVAQADVIFTGEVMDVRAFALQTPSGPIIKTRVIFRVTDPIAGTGASLEVFEFLGGQIGDVGLVVAEMPTFAVGDRRVVSGIASGNGINNVIWGDDVFGEPFGSNVLAVAQSWRRGNTYTESDVVFNRAYT